LKNNFESTLKLETMRFRLFWLFVAQKSLIFAKKINLFN
jgi:hypothetical protein